MRYINTANNSFKRSSHGQTTLRQCETDLRYSKKETSLLDRRAPYTRFTKYTRTERTQFPLASQMRQKHL